MQHDLILTARSLGGRRKGTNAACSCQQWDGLFSNDKNPDQARRSKWGQAAHAKHVASTTVESDIVALKALIARTQRLLADDIEHGYASFIQGRIKKLDGLVVQLLADLAEMVAEDNEEDLDKAQAEHNEWMDSQTWAPDGI
jgi:hypothetical protein